MIRPPFPVPTLVFAALLALSVSHAALAQQSPIERIKMSDGEATCPQIYAEIGEMDKAAAEAKVAESEGQSAASVAAAGGAAAQIASRTGLFGSVGGLMGHVVGSVASQSAATAAQQSGQQNTQQAQERGRQAVARKEHLTSLFLGRGCKVSDMNKSSAG